MTERVDAEGEKYRWYVWLERNVWISFDLRLKALFTHIKHLNQLKKQMLHAKLWLHHITLQNFFLPHTLLHDHGRTDEGICVNTLPPFTWMTRAVFLQMVKDCVNVALGIRHKLKSGVQMCGRECDNQRVIKYTFILVMFIPWGQLANFNSVYVFTSVCWCF